MTEQEIEDFEDYLVDVLRVWDCHVRNWVPDTPVLLRFESSDVVVYQDRSMYIGIVYSERPFKESIGREHLSKMPLTDACPTWISDTSGINCLYQLSSAFDAYESVKQNSANDACS